MLRFVHTVLMAVFLAGMIATLVMNIGSWGTDFAASYVCPENTLSVEGAQRYSYMPGQTGSSAFVGCITPYLDVSKTLAGFGFVTALSMVLTFPLCAYYFYWVRRASEYVFQFQKDMPWWVVAVAANAALYVYFSPPKPVYPFVGASVSKAMADIEAELGLVPSVQRVLIHRSSIEATVEVGAEPVAYDVFSYEGGELSRSVVRGRKKKPTFPLSDVEWEKIPSLAVKAWEKAQFRRGRVTAMEITPVNGKPLIRVQVEGEREKRVFAYLGNGAEVSPRGKSPAARSRTP